MPSQIEPDEFLAVVQPRLARKDATGLAQSVSARWRPRDVCSLLNHHEADIRATAAMVLGLIGTIDDGPALTRALHDQHPCVHEMAEHALWSVWFRAGSPEAAAPFSEGISHLAEEDYDDAVRCFERSHHADPTFAEAFNQCAIAHYFQGDWEASLADCRRAVARVPAHFGAILGMGHCFAQMGELDLALSAYRRALAVNPRMPAIEGAVQRLSRGRAVAGRKDQ